MSQYRSYFKHIHGQLQNSKEACQYVKLEARVRWGKDVISCLPVRLEKPVKKCSPLKVGESWESRSYPGFLGYLHSICQGPGLQTAEDPEWNQNPQLSLWWTPVGKQQHPFTPRGLKSPSCCPPFLSLWTLAPPCPISDLSKRKKKKTREALSTFLTVLRTEAAQKVEMLASKARQHEMNPWDSCGRRETTPPRCLLNSMCVQWPTHVYTYTNKYHTLKTTLP